MSFLINREATFLLSVIMLTYNRKEYVKNMIEDIINQSYRKFECIIINNGSTDGTDKVLDMYAGLDPRIRVITLTQSYPIGRARNIGVGHAVGEYITFVDDDDSLMPEYLQYLVELITEFDAQIAVAGTGEEKDGIVRPQCTFSERECLTGEQAVYELLQRKKSELGQQQKYCLNLLLRSIRFQKRVIMKTFMLCISF